MCRLFYCPVCKLESYNFTFKDEIDKRSIKTWINFRGGFGVVIDHIICPNCSNPLSGVMLLKTNKSDEIDYCKNVIKLYNIESKDGGLIQDGELEIFKIKLLKEHNDKQKQII